MTRIDCFTCTASLTAPDDTTVNELSAVNNWLPVRIEGVAGYLCEQCSKWIDMPIRIWRYREPEYFYIKKRKMKTKI
jgi:hypothetical protein